MRPEYLFLVLEGPIPFLLVIIVIEVRGLSKQVLFQSGTVSVCVFKDRGRLGVNCERPKRFP